MKRSEIKLDEYSRRLWSQREKEVVKESAENLVNLQEGKGLTSPVSDLPTEELKMVQQYIDRKNLMNIGKALPKNKQQLVLRRFFRQKRNQQVEVYTKHGEKVTHIVGKVKTIGRNFVTITTLKDRIWIPFAYVESAKVPYGLPEVSSAHQHFVYDKELRNKLITRFSETVAEKDVLVQQFFEETLETNLQTWKGSRVQVVTTKEEVSGKIKTSQKGKIVIKGGRGEQTILLQDIILVRGIRLFKFLSY